MEKVNVYSQEFWVKSFIGYLTLSIPVMALSIILNIAGVVPMNINGEENYGVASSLVFLIYYPLMSFFAAITNWVIIMCGYWVYTRLKGYISNKHDQDSDKSV